MFKKRYNVAITVRTAGYLQNFIRNYRICVEISTLLHDLSLWLEKP